MRKILKWSWDPDTVAQLLIQAPIERFLTSQIQDGKIAVWGLVDTRKSGVEWLLYTVHTGQPLFEGMRGEYLGTLQLSNGLVKHVFAQKVYDKSCETGWM